jgi:hypothetical protein
MTMIKEGDRVRLLTDTIGIEGTVVPAGTQGTVVDDTHAPAEYAIDVVLNDAFDNVTAASTDLEGPL